MMSNNVVRNDAEPMTIDKLMEVFETVKQLPPPPFLASSMMFQEGRALKFEVGGQEFFGAHPNDWRQATDKPEGPPLTLFGESLVKNIDVSTKHRSTFYRAMRRAYEEHRQ